MGRHLRHDFGFMKRWRWGALILCAWNLSVTAGCNRAPREPTDRLTLPPTTDADEPSVSPGGTPGPTAAPACVVPLAEPPPPEVGPVEDCPQDPDGRPHMPYGVVTFPEAPRAPELTVELALTPDHQAHGLMYRPTLGDSEGMLFSWQEERQRFFWMRNTCLALDMLFIAKDGTIAGILENVPPMNDRPQRTVRCPVAHVLEVRAGWTRTYGVTPGQKMVAHTQPN